MTQSTPLSFDYLRQQTIGVDAPFQTPYGTRTQTYCDFTASGKSLWFIEKYMTELLSAYANTHTEDDYTGEQTTALYHQAEEVIKHAVNAGDDGRIVCTGSGATAAITRIQQFLGVYLPAPTRALLDKAVSEIEGNNTFQSALDKQQSVVFIGPYEHHSNEVTWREGLSEIVEVRMSEDGGIDLAHLEQLLLLPEYQGRLRIGSFSAASNVTGRLSPVKDIAALLHAHDALAFFDYAASAPYVEIDMNPAGAPKCAIDAVFISPHKFLGGPGSSGVLVFNQKFYARDLPPSVAGGGTVDYVSEQEHDFIDNIEARENAGTPGVLQTIRAALAFEVKQSLGADAIIQREHAILQRVFNTWNTTPAIEILGHQDPAQRVAIVSFNLRHTDGLVLHPKFVTRLLSDLFGIQSRAGCSCAGPYGHRLLAIKNEQSQQFRDVVNQGYNAVKPGWCRIGFHYSMDDVDVEFVIEAVQFIAEHGHYFLPDYQLNWQTGAWLHSKAQAHKQLSLQDAVNSETPAPTALTAGERKTLNAQYLAEALYLAQASRRKPEVSVPASAQALQFFTLGS